MITNDALRRIMPRLSGERCTQYLPHLQQAMEEFGISEPLRKAAFLAQIAHESGEFRFMEEIWGPTDAQRRYEPQSELAQRLGNTEVGDGKRFKGRGPIQVTGRANYQRYGQLLGIDLVNNPVLAASPEVSFRIAGLYWQKNGLNELADQEMFKSITKRINGGFNGLEDRRRYYETARNVLGVHALRGIGPEDTGDDTAIPRFTRGLDSAGEITPTGVQRGSARRVMIGVKKDQVAASHRRAATKNVAAAATKKVVAKKVAKAVGKDKVDQRVEANLKKTARSSGAKRKKAAAGRA
jgi:putative chitinase